jgi:hypothetical protein
MYTCAVCQQAIEGPHLSDAEASEDFHPECTISSLADDAFFALMGMLVLVLVLVPAIVVWAG